MLTAKRHELKQMFFRHYQVFQREQDKPSYSHCLLLFYAVECGLKALVLTQIKGNTTNDFERHQALKGKLSGNHGHNIRQMLDYLNQSRYRFPVLPCKNGQRAEVHQYHQVWRYGIEAELSTQRVILSELKKLAIWIEERFRHV